MEWSKTIKSVKQPKKQIQLVQSVQNGLSQTCRAKHETLKFFIVFIVLLPYLHPQKQKTNKNKAILRGNPRKNRDTTHGIKFVVSWNNDVQLWEVPPGPPLRVGVSRDVHMSGCQVIGIQETIGSKPSPRATRVEAWSLTKPAATKRVCKRLRILSWFHWTDGGTSWTTDQM